MFRSLFIPLLTLIFIGLQSLPVEAQRRGGRGGGRGGGRSGVSRSAPRRAPSRPAPSRAPSRSPSRAQFRGSPSANRGNANRPNINRSNLPGSTNRGSLPGSANRGNPSGNLNRNNFSRGLNRGNLGGNNNRGVLPGSNNRDLPKPGSTFGNKGSSFGSGNRNLAQRGSGFGNSGNSAGRNKIDSFLNSPGGSTRDRPSTLPSTGSGWNSKTFETARGGTVTVGGGAGSRTGPNGGQIGGAGKGVKIETAGGRTISKGGLAAGGRDGQGNAAVGGIKGGRATDGRGNSVGGVRGGAVDNRGNYRGGAAAGKKSWGYAQVTGRGVAGNINTGNRVARGGTAVRGPWGNVVTTGRGARFVNGQFVGGRTWAAVNRNFVRWNAFGPRWWGRYPNYWWPRRWFVGRVWWVPAWGVTAPYVGIDDPGIYYDYGNNVTINEGDVYYEDTKIATTEEFYDKANEIANAGLNSTNDEWMPLGVYAYVKNPEQTETERIIQLALNKEKAIRGNLHDLLTDKVIPVYGSVEEGSQRVALKMEGNDSVVLEVGLYNLTNDEVPVLVHFSKDRQEDAMLIRLKNPEEESGQETSTDDN